MIYLKISLENTEEKGNRNKEIFNVNYGLLEKNIMGSTFKLSHLKQRFWTLKKTHTHNYLISQSVKKLI